MKKLTLILSAALFAAAAQAEPAGRPRAAEEPSAVVVSTDAPAPRAQMRHAGPKKKSGHAGRSARGAKGKAAGATKPGVRKAGAQRHARRR